MRFIPEGPDVPDELIRAQAAGETVFLCGAGVSMTEGLPSFRTLVERVYAALHEHWAHHPVEAKGMGREAPVFDRALFALRTRLSGIGAARARRGELNLVEAVRAALATPEGALPNHLDVLRLSCGSDARPRVVTTNFDTLFEAAWVRAGSRPLPSHAGPALPPPGSPGFEGVLHLHGRLEDDALGLSRSGLVLASDEFGEAYLRSGWAARYVYDLARASTLVIVGYGADDPPMRYLLEVLTADRSRFTDLRPIFAFVDAADDLQRREKAADWAARGAVPIVYEVRDHDHGALYGTLGAWADQTENPAPWRRDRSTALLSRPPEDMADHEWPQLRFALGQGDAARLVEAANPSPGWLSPLLSRVLLDGTATVLGPWIAKRFAEPGMLDEAIGHLKVDERMAWQIDRALVDTAPPEPMNKVWRLLARVRAPLPWHEGWYSQLERVARGETGHDVRRALADLLRPAPRVRPAMRWPGRAAPSWTRVFDYAWIEFTPRGHVEPRKLLEVWPPTLDALLLRQLLAALLDALDEAAHLEVVAPDYDRASHDVSSVAPHPQDSLPDHGFYPIVRTIADLAERLVESEPMLVRSIFNPLAPSSYALPRRLHLYVLTFAPVASGDDVAHALRSLDDADFWSGDLRRETMRLMAERWADIPDAERDAIEARIAARMPTSLLHVDAAPADQIDAIRDHAAFARLTRLEATATGLGPVGRDALAQVRADHPGWEAEPGDRADFGSWSESRMGDQGDPSLLRDVPVERLVAEARDIAERDHLNQGEIWQKYVRVDPARAFEGLIAAGAGASVAHWRQYIITLLEMKEAGLARRTVAHLAAAAPELVAGVLSVASSWLDWSYDDLVAAHDGEAVVPMRLWDRLADHLAADMADEAPPPDDPLFAVLNRPPGHLANALVAELLRRHPDPGAGMPPDLAPRLDRLVALPGTAGFVALAGLMRWLPRLHLIDPDRAEATLVPRLVWADPWAEALWLTYAANGWLGTERLFRIVKPMLLAAFERPATKATLLERLLDHLLTIVLAQTGKAAEELLVGPLELKRALALSPESARTHAAYVLFDRVRGAEEPAQAWRDVVAPAFAAIWPMQADLRSEGTSLYLTWMASAAGEAFPEAVAAVAPALLPTARTNHSMFDSLDEDRADLYRKHPGAALALMDGLTDDAHPADDLAEPLEELAGVNPSLRRDPRFERLWALAGRSGRRT